MFVIILLVFVVGFIIYFYVNEWRETRNGPPGFLPLPIFGNLLNLALASSVPHLAILKLSQKYEDIFRIKLGSQNVCIINSIEAIQTIFTNANTSGRDVVGTIADRNFGKSGLGIIFSEGLVHQQMKNWMVRNLGNYGFGKSNTMERIINQELNGILKDIEKAIDCNKGIMNIEHAFIFSIFKVAWQMIKGPATPEDDVMIKRLILKSEDMISKGLVGAGLVNAFPVLRFILPEFGHKQGMAFYKDCDETAKMLLNISKTKLKSKGSAENLIESFAQKMEEESNNPQTIFTTEQFLVLFKDLLQGSSDTTSSFLETCILYSVLYPDVQSKIYEEIQRCIPQDRDVESADKKGMIYTQAFFLETHRQGKTSQNLIPHKCLGDVKYKNYVIKKGTVLLANLYTANNDPKIWNNPECFLPERFIDESGQLINQLKILPFGIGSRRCPGELFANATYFLMYVNIVRKYQLSQVPRQIPPRADLNVTFTSKPFPFQVLFTKRTE